MKTQAWHFEINQYDTVTKNNFKLADIISRQHMNALFSESLLPVIGIVYNNFHHKD